MTSAVSCPSPEIRRCDFDFSAQAGRGDKLARRRFNYKLERMCPYRISDLSAARWRGSCVRCRRRDSMRQACRDRNRQPVLCRSLTQNTWRMWRSARRGDLTNPGERPALCVRPMVHRWRLTKASGDMIVIRYADDTIVGLQHQLQL